MFTRAPGRLGNRDLVHGNASNGVQKLSTTTLVIAALDVVSGASLLFGDGIITPAISD